MRSADACVPLRLKRNWISHVVAVGCGENSQRCAAFRASPAKDLLGPAFFRFADLTFPDGPTSTCTVTLIVPVIVFREFLETSGMTSWTTSPWAATAFFRATPV